MQKRLCISPGESTNYTPTYFYLAPKLEIIFAVTKHFLLFIWCRNCKETLTTLFITGDLLSKSTKVEKTETFQLLAVVYFDQCLDGAFQTFLLQKAEKRNKNQEN